MPGAASLDQYRKLLQTRLEACRASTQAVLYAFTDSADVKARQAACSTLIRDLELLRDNLHETDRPSWIGSLERVARKYCTHSNSDTGRRVLESIVAVSNEMLPLNVDESGSSEIDFDAIFARHRDEGRLPQLFDELIEQLTKILDCPEIDSKAIDAALSKLIATLKANKSGSFVAVSSTLDLQRYVWNLMGPSLKQIPGAAPFVEAYEKTKADAEKEFEDIKQKDRDEVLERLRNALPGLEVLSQLAQRAALPLPPQQAKALPPTESVEDVTDAVFEEKVESGEPDAA